MLLTTLLKITGASLLMRVAANARMLPALAIGAALFASGAFAQESQPKGGMPPASGHGGMMSGNMQTMAMHNQMMADMKTMEASLDLKVAAMNAAKGRDKVDATAAVVNEMVSQQKQMMAKMMGMHNQMMMGMKGMDEKSPEAHKEHHE